MNHPSPDGSPHGNAKSQIGACAAWFADWANGGGEWYPTSATGAYDRAPTMLSGWDNDVSSVYIT